MTTKPEPPATGATDAKLMRKEFLAWVKDRGCDTDGAWSAWQAAWNLRAPKPVGAAAQSQENSK